MPDFTVEVHVAVTAHNADAAAEYVANSIREQEPNSVQVAAVYDIDGEEV